LGFIVDSHAHVLAESPIRYPTRPLEPEVSEQFFRSPVTGERLLRAMDEAGVEAALLVQRGQIYGFDNSYVCDVTGLAPDRLRCVVSIDATDPGCALVARQWLDRGAAGLRLMQQRRDTSLDWLGADGDQAIWRFAAEAGPPMCVHFFAPLRNAGLARLASVLDTYSDIPVVLDHLTNLPLTPEERDPDAILRLFADRGNVSLKFTTIPLAYLAAECIPASDVLRRFISVFGADRLMWGSDVSQSPGSYRELLQLALDATAELGEEGRNWLLGGTAARIYRCGAPVPKAATAAAAQ
jgi:predicted TIM-barrel fold metal-dependent hydrolase